MKLTRTPIWASIKLLILDVDGVLSDGRIYLSDQQEELKAFHVQDGFGIRLLLQNGVQIAVITARSSPLVQWRMESLGVRHVYQGASSKLPIYQKLLADLRLTAEEVAYMGDDWPDLAVMTRVGTPIAVANAVPEVSERAVYQTQIPGGLGAVREVANHILKAQGYFEQALARYIKGDM